jgi:uncharacterized lipoprotein YmbA
MKTKPVTNLFLFTLIAAIAAGCASAPSRYYTLTSTATADGTPAVHCTIVVDPVSVPALVDCPQFTIQVTPNRVELDEFDRWAEPLDDSIARVIAGNLTVLLGTSQVAAVPLANFDADYRVTIDIQRFESVPGKSVLIEALWVVRKSKGGAAQSGSTLAAETVSSDGCDALAAAHSRALAMVSGDIAAAIRAQAGIK